MKKNFFFLLIMIFSICGALSYFETPAQLSYAVSTNVSTWDLNGKDSYEDLGGSDFQGVTESEYFATSNAAYINSARGFAYFAYLVNNNKDTMSTKTVYLNVDVDLGDYEWKPIFNFQGDFNGQGHYVYNLKITKVTQSSGQYYAGLFGSYSASSKKSISNLHLRNADINIQNGVSGTAYVGGILGGLGVNALSSSNSASVSNCSVKGNISVKSSSGSVDVGGVIGGVWNNDGVSKIMSSGKITVDAANINVGGLVGSFVSGALKNSYSEADITLNSSNETSVKNVGGLVGYLKDSASNSSSWYTRVANVSDSYFKGVVNTPQSYVRVGGIVGRMDVLGAEENNTISNVFNVGQITAGNVSTNASKAGLVGWATWQTGKTGSGLLKNSFAKDFSTEQLFKTNSSSSGSQSFSGKGLVGSELANLDEFSKTKGFYENEKFWETENAWDFENTWEIQSGLNEGLPYLRGVYQMGAANNDQDLSQQAQLRGAGTAQNPYLIETAGDFAYLTSTSTIWNGNYFSLQNNIDMSNKTWVPIGNENNPFSGVFDGNGFTISNLTSSYLNAFSSIGLFGQTQNAVIKNLTIENCDFYSTASAKIGAFVGTAGSETYLINVKNSTSYNAVGDGNVTKIKGKLNAEGRENFDGYDITIDPNGGTFYSPNKQAYRGEYHIILREDGSVLSQEIDTTFGRSIPDISTQYGKADTIIRRGYKRLGFSASKEDNVVSDAGAEVLTDAEQILAAAKENLQLYTVWLSGADGALLTQELYVVYNQYEVANFDAELNSGASYLTSKFYSQNREFNLDGFGATYGHGETIDGINEDNVYAKFQLIYDAQTEEYENVLWGEPEYSDGTVKKLRDGFVVAGLHTGFDGTDFEDDVISPSFGFINEQFSPVLYAEWKGLPSSGGSEGNYSQKLKITFKKSIDSTQKWTGFDNFTWEEVFGISKEKNVHLEGISTDEQVHTYSQNSIGSQTEDLVVEFTFGTNYSDRANNYLHLYTDNIQAGFNMGRASLKNSPEDTNFGKLKTTLDVDDETGLHNFDISGTKIYNLVGDNELEIYIERQEIFSDVTISDNVQFALSPFVEVEGASSYEISITKGEESKAISAEEQIFGYDFKNNQVLLMSKDGAIKEESLTDEFKLDTADEKLLFTVTYHLNDADTQKFYYVYKYEQKGDNNWLALYSADEDGNEKLLIMALKDVEATNKEIQSQLVTFSNSKQNFALIYKTEEGFSVSTREPNFLEAVKVEGKEGDAVVRGYFGYKDVNEFAGRGIALLTSYNSIFLNYNFEYDGNRNQELFDTFKQASTLVSQANYQTTTDGPTSELSMAANAQKYFRLNTSAKVTLVSVELQKDAQGQTPAAVNNEYTISEPFSFNIDLDEGKEKLVAGQYTVTVHFEDVTYSVNYGAKFVSHSNMKNFESLVGKGENYTTLLKDYDGDYLTVSENLQDAQEKSSKLENADAEVKLLQKTDLLYNDEISLKQNEENVGKIGVNYYGFYLRTNTGRELNKRVEYSNTLGAIYDGVSRTTGEDSAVGKYILNVIVIFEVREMTLEVSNTIIVENFDNTGVESHATLNKDLKIEFSSTPKKYEYKNISGDGQSTTLNFAFPISSQGNEVGYDIVGVRILHGGEKVDLDDGQWESENSGTPNAFEKDFKETFDKLLENQTETTQNYSFQIVVKQKVAEIILHSGAGETYRQENSRAGKVTNSNGEDVTNNAYTTTAYFGGSTVSLTDGTVMIGEKAEFIRNLFVTRYGYTPNGWNIHYGGDGELEDLYIGYSFTFNLSTQQYSTYEDGSYKFHIYMCWDALGFKISFDSNGGEERVADLSIDFDEKIDFNSLKTVSRAGYSFKGWALQNNLLFEYSGTQFSIANAVISGDSVIISDTKYFAKDGDEWLYAYSGNIQLLAQWEANSYKVTVDFNRKSAGGETKTFDIIYEKQDEFKKILSDEELLNLTRSKFTFAGIYYILNDNLVQLLESNLLVNGEMGVDITSHTAAGTNVLTLYVGWTFDYENGYSLELTDKDFEQQVYDGSAKTIDLSKKFTADNIASKSGFVIPGKDGKFIGVEEDNNVSLSFEVDGQARDQFTVSQTNAGQYIFYLTLVLTDNSKNVSGQDIVGQVAISFTFTITPASVDAQTDDEQYRFVFAKMIIEPYYIKSEIDELENFEAIVSYLSEKESARAGDADTLLTTAEPQDAFNYIIFKHYNLGITTGTQYVDYKNWTYQDYLDYKEENGEEVENVRNLLTYFDYFTYGSQEKNFEASFSSQGIFSLGELATKDELSITSIKIYTDVASFMPNLSYTLRVFVDAKDKQKLNNFYLSTDGEDYYFDFGNATLLKEVLEVNNHSDYDFAYYMMTSSSRVEAGFDADIENEQLQDKIKLAKDALKTKYGRDFYLVDAERLIFASANVFTSTTGSAEKDTTYTFKQEGDFLHFDNVLAYALKDIEVEPNLFEFENVSSIFNLTMNESYEFKILGLQDVYHIVLQANYFTQQDGEFVTSVLDATTLQELKVSTDFLKDFLYISDVRYTSNESVGMLSLDDTKSLSERKRVYADERVFIADIMTMNGYQIDIYVSRAVTQITFNTKQFINNNVGIFAWKNSDMVSESELKAQWTLPISYTWEAETVADQEFSAQTISLYAIYTDLIYVSYNNIPGEDEIPAERRSHALIKLGVSTYDDVYKPEVSGFTLDSLIYSGDITFKGLFANGGEGIYHPTFYDANSPASIFKCVDITCYWTMDVDILYEAFNGDNYVYTTDIYDFTDTWNVNTLLHIRNENNVLFDYSYKWVKVLDGEEKVISQTEEFALEGKGSYAESGKYKLYITSNLKEKYSKYVAEDGVRGGKTDYTFTLNFVRRKLTSITPSNTTADYNGREQISDWSITFTYTNSRGREASYSSTYSPDSAFLIKYEDAETKSMKDAGVYTIRYTISSDDYDISELDQDSYNVFDENGTYYYQFEYTINAIVVEIDTFEVEKTFNTLVGQTVFIQNVTVSQTNETIAVELTRDESHKSDEHVGEYSLYLDGSGEYTKNYILKKGETTLVDKGEILDTKTVLGTLKIKQSGGLTVTFEDLTTSTYTTSFKKEGFSFEITTQDGKIVLKIVSGGNAEQTYNLQLLDKSAGSVITEKVILDILIENLSDITESFRSEANGETATTVKNSGTYYYETQIGENFLKYYQTFEISNAFKFVIEKAKINSDTWKISKTYDGTNTLNLNLQGEALEDETEMYVVATFTSGFHAGTNLRVTLALAGESEDLSNYTLTKTEFEDGEIKQRNATITFGTTKTQYEYGEVSASNFKTILQRESVKDGGTDVSNILYDNTYELSYELTAKEDNLTQSDRGFYYVGTYTFKIQTISSQDFVFTIEVPTFSIVAKNVTHVVTPVSRTILDSVETDITDTYTDPVTGDVITLHYTIKETDYNNNGRYKQGTYNFVLSSCTSDPEKLKDNFNISIDENNNGLTVTVAATTLYVEISDEQILSQTYNAKTYEFQVSGSALSLKNSTQEQTSVNLTFYIKTDENGGRETITSVDASGLTIYSGRETDTTFKDAGTYTLLLKGTVDGYTAVSFAKKYDFVIGKVTLTVSDETVTKTYDKTTKISSISVTGAISGDDVVVSGEFEDSNVNKVVDGEVQLWNVQLSLSGTAASNYALSKDTIKGEIQKADAEIEYSGQTTAIFGEIDKNFSFDSKVTVKATDKSEVARSQYELSVSISRTADGDLYSEANYLHAGSYTITFSAVESATRNYNITQKSITLTVTARQIQIVFVTSGQIKAFFGDKSTQTNQIDYVYTVPRYNETISLVLTREKAETNAIGYYKITGATVKTGETYSDDYSISSVSDNTPEGEGAYQIVAPDVPLYVLLGEADTINKNSYSDLLKIEYDGKVYSSISIGGDAETGYELVVTSSDGETSHRFKISFYTVDEAGQVYTKHDAVAGLSSQFSYVGALSKDVGTYAMRAYSTVAGDYSQNVKLGLYGEQNCFKLSITQRKVTLKVADNIFSREFTNAQAVYHFTSAESQDMLSNLVSGEGLGFTLTMYENTAEAGQAPVKGGIAKYVNASSDYILGGEIDPTDANRKNYILSVENVVGKITKATLYIVIDNSKLIFDYGTLKNDENLPFTYDAPASVINFSSYLEDETSKQRLDFDIKVDAENASISTSGFLDVGFYDVRVYTKSVLDFDLQYMVNGTIYNADEGRIRAARVEIEQIPLTITEKDGLALSTLFTKRYDGTKTIDFKDGDQLKFNLVGVLEKDLVTLENVEYENSLDGERIPIIFTFNGDDVGNYNLSAIVGSYFGTITAVQVNIAFDTKAEAGDEIVNQDGKGVSEIIVKYPFASGNIMASSVTPGAIFPTDIRGKAGHAFLGWYMLFEDIEENSKEYNLLVNYSQNMQFTYSERIFKVKIENNTLAVDFFKALLEDQTLGFYYQDEKFTTNGQPITFTLEADWSVNSYEVTINIVDENGDKFAEEYDLATVKYGTAQTLTQETEMFDIKGHTFSHMVVFDYGFKVGFILPEDAKCTFIGFYLGTTPINELADDNFRADSTLLSITNVKEAYEINLRFKIRTVEVSLDFSDCRTATVANTDDFTSQGDRIWAWQTNYYALKENSTSIKDLLDLAQVQFAGYNLTSLGTHSAEQFEQTHLFEILPSELIDDRYVLTLLGSFEAKQISVTLHFGYDKDEGEGEKVETHEITFDTTFGEAEWWQETPTRAGYDFVEWSTSNSGDGHKVDGQTQVTQEEAYVLYAIWEKQKITIHFEVENATLEFQAVEGLTVIQYAWGYEIKDIEYAASIIFTITPRLGYGLGELPKEFSVVEGNRYQFTVPANPDREQFLVFKLPVNKNNNQVTLSGDEHVSTVAAFEGETSKDVEADQFEVLTDTAFRIEVTAEKGYEMTEEFSVTGNPDENTDFNISSRVNTIMLENEERSVLTVSVTGIKSGLNFVFSTAPRRNTILVAFKDPEDNNSLEAIDDVYYNGASHTVTENPLALTVLTGTSYDFHVKFAYGFDYQKGDFEADKISVSDDAVSEYEGYVKFTISGAETDGTITISTLRKQFTLTLKVVSYDTEGQLVEDVSNNVAFVNNENGADGVLVDYNTEAILTVQKATAFDFEGWLEDYNSQPISGAEQFRYKVVADKTLYAVFYEGESYRIWFGTVLLEETFVEQEQNLVKYEDYRIYDDGGLFFDKDEVQLQSDSSAQFSFIKNISSTEFMYELPLGFDFVGVGYYLNGDFKVAFRGEFDTLNGKAIFTLAGSQLASDVTKVYAILQAKDVVLNFSSEIEIEGAISEDDVDDPVGDVSIRSGSNVVNSFGYINYTRIHYSGEDFVGGKLLSTSQFSVMAYSNCNFEFLVKIRKKGYMLSRIDYSGDISIYNKEEQTEDGLLYTIYILSTNTGSFDIKLVYTSQLNFVDLSFVSERTGNDYEVDGGVFDVQIDENSVGRAWTTNNQTAMATVSGYTNVGFKVTAYIRAGFTYKGLFVLAADDMDIITAEALYETLVIEDTGFTGKVTFSVANFLDLNKVKIILTPTVYTVLFKDDNTTLLTKEVYFYENFEFDNVEMSKLQAKKTNYVYQGYFTRQNGAGKLYVNSDIMFVGPWLENGYVLNSITPTKFVLEDNAQKLPDGTIEISLYLYMSYLKTRITFSFNTPLDFGLTAKDLISGIDDYNSWYYFTEPMSIEVAYGTDIRFVGPKISGYEFYKMIISQRRPGESDWTEIDTSNYGSSNNIPWLSDEADPYAECRVELWYFREISVQIRGGLGKFTLSQDGYDASSRGNAYALNQKGYYDPNKEVTVTAEADYGYEFVSWSSYPLIGRPTTNPVYTVTPAATRQLSLRLVFAGKGVLLRFEYDNTNGKITEASRKGFDGESLGAIQNPTDFSVLVGDTLTLCVYNSPNYGLSWTIRYSLGETQAFTDIKFVKYQSGHQYFEFKVLPEFIPVDWTEGYFPEVVITPIFESERLSVFITTSLSEDLENAVDENNVKNIGYLTYLGNAVESFTADISSDIQIEVVAMDRYSISQITITNKGNVLDDLTLFDGKTITLSSQFIADNQIEGSVGIDVVFAREEWEDLTLEIEELSGLGTNENPFSISSIEDLILMMRLVNGGEVSRRGIKYADASYVLLADLNLNDKFWTPIGTEENPFNGKFNFNGHRIDGVNNAIFYEQVYYFGLFGVLGPRATLLMRAETYWYIYLIVFGAIVLLVVLFIAFFYARKRKKTIDELSKK